MINNNEWYEYEKILNNLAMRKGNEKWVYWSNINYTELYCYICKSNFTVLAVDYKFDLDAQNNVQGVREHGFIHLKEKNLIVLL